MLISHLFTWL